MDEVKDEHLSQLLLCRPLSVLAAWRTGLKGLHRVTVDEGSQIEDPT